MGIPFRKSVIKILFFFLLIFATNIQAQKKNQTHARSPFIPQDGILQYAGSIGLVSAGIGYRYGNNKFETDGLFGYLPKKVGGAELYTAAIKANWLPFQLPLNSTLSLTPLTTGLMASYTFGDKYFFLPPDQYPKGYYNFSTAAHLYYQLGSRLNIAPQKGSFPPISFYYEFNSSAEAIISALQNRRTLTPFDIFYLSLGLRVGF